MKKRILSLLLCGAMLFSLCCPPALAEETGQAGDAAISTGGLCEHHPAHDAACGYIEETAGTPCSHEHSADCCETITNCVHAHDANCCPQESVSGAEAPSSDAQNQKPENYPHICSEESGCITQKSNCQHQHNDACGCTEGTRGTSCGFVCEICSPQNSSEPTDKPECICETLCTADAINTACPVCGAEGADPALCKGSAEPAAPSPAEAVTVAGVQAMIDALPGAEQITEENAEAVTAQLEAIDEAKEKLSDEEIAAPDMTRYREAAAALSEPAVPMLLAANTASVTVNGIAAPDEQFSIAPGGTYYFDLSGKNIPGTANSGNSNGAASLPDTSLHYVPFTYAGTVEAYKLTSEMATTEAYAQQNKYAHSLFVADYVVTHTVSWNDLDTASLIFGKAYASGGVGYTLRAPSAGSNATGSGDSKRGTPTNNEWDTILDKYNGYIQNGNKIYSWGQDTRSVLVPYLYRAVRGSDSARSWSSINAPGSGSFCGFRPVLEVLNADTLGSDGLKAVTLDLNGGKLGGNTDDIQIIVKSSSAFTAPASDGLTRPDGDTGSYFMWLGSNGKLYAPGSNVPADVTELTAQWLDVAAPTGKIQIAQTDWNHFLSSISFELFFKDSQTVTITANDNSGEAVTIEYLLSDTALTEAELNKKAFTAYTAPISILPDHKYVVYAKLTDTSGNTAYINTDGLVLDATAPVISGIANGKNYCEAQTVAVTEEYLDTVTVNGTAVALDSNHRFTLKPADGTQVISVTDKAGNHTTVSVTVNDGHTYEWQSENGRYWQKCKSCGTETAKKVIPTFTINGADQICRTQDYKFSFTLPKGTANAVCQYEFAGSVGGTVTPTLENSLYSGIVKTAVYPASENRFKLIVRAKTNDGFAFSAEKTVEIQNEHSGSTATCKDKAKCAVCGESYGSLNAANHAHLEHINAKAATKAATGNIEYWYCSGCGKYYKDAAAAKEITQADTITAKLSSHSSSSQPQDPPQAEVSQQPEAAAQTGVSPQTGDNSNVIFWVVLLLVSGIGIAGGVVYSKKKKEKGE